jgi:hypothetical protein
LSGLSSQAADTVRSIREEGLSAETILAWIVLGALVGNVE